MNNQSLIRNYYTKFVKTNKEDSAITNALDDILKISYFDFRFFKIEDFKEFQNLSIALIHYIQKGTLDVEFYKSAHQNTFKIRTILSRFTSSLRVLTHDSFLEGHKSESFLNHLNDTIDLIKWLQNELNHFVPEVKLELPLTEEEKVRNYSKNIDNRKSQDKEPTNDQKFIALKEFCPELMYKLQKSNVKTKSEVVHFITGANKTDCYKTLFTGKELQYDLEIVEQIEELKKKLESI